MTKTMCSLLILTLHCIIGLAQSANHEILSRKVSDVTISQENAFWAMKDLSTTYNIPMGVEMSPAEHPMKTGSSPLAIKVATVGDALGAFSTLNPRYEWSVNDGRISIRPKPQFSREALLDLRLARFDVDNENMNAVSRMILDHSDVKAFLEEQRLVANTDNTAFGAAGSRTVSFSTQGLTIRELLDHLLKKGFAKHWMIYRHEGARPYVKLILQ